MTKAFSVTKGRSRRGQCDVFQLTSQSMRAAPCTLCGSAWSEHPEAEPKPRRPLIQMPALQRGEDAGERRERYGDNGDCVKPNEMVHVPPGVVVTAGQPVKGGPIFRRLWRLSSTTAIGRLTPWVRVAERSLSVPSFHAVLLHGV
jgi:hypothetical protein